MTAIHWASPVSGLFSDAADWTGGVVPGGSDGAILNAVGGNAYTVTSDVSQTVSFLQTSVGASLYITGGTFTARGGTGTGHAYADSIQSLVFVEANSTLVVGGTLALNGGWISLGSGSGTTSLIFNRDTTLTGQTVAGVVPYIVTSQFSNSVIEGANAGVVLTNNDWLDLGGPTALGNGKLTLVNTASGVIWVLGHSVTIDTGHSILENAGLILVGGAGQCLITSAVDNTGQMDIQPGRGGAATDFLRVEGAVTGSGSVLLDGGGSVFFMSSFNENVAFDPVRFGEIRGRLVLAQSQGYSGAITGFSNPGTASLDLRDIGFVSAGEATFSGTSSSGVLTVTDGAHTANINLIGDFTSETFAARSDGHGGVIVTAAASAATAPPHRLIAAMASLGAPAGSATHSAEARALYPPIFARPHANVA